MKKLATILSILAVMTTVGYSQFTVGAGAAYVFPGSSFGFQSKSLIGINEDFDISPSAGILLEDGTPFVIDVDLHYKLLEVSDDFRIMPFAGLNYVNSEGSDLGINLGVSFRIDVNENTLYIEPKFTIISYGGMALAAGMLF